MKFLREQLDKIEPHFVKGGKLEKFYTFYEALDTFAYSPGSVTENQTHVRDGMDLKRMMICVAVALLPCVIMAMYNTGLQAHLALEATGSLAAGWRADIMSSIGIPMASENILSNTVHGALYFLPVYIVSMTFGGIIEAIFATARGHEINEGFVVTGLLFPLTLPPTIPLWQVAMAIMFAVLFGKEMYGGTGKNFLNIAILARAFLYFAYPGEISGDAVWVASSGIDGYSAATPLAQVAAAGPGAITVSWDQAFKGLMPGSMGETSVVAALLGGFYLIWTGIGSWKTMISCVVGLVVTITIFNGMGASPTNPALALGPEWHVVIGGFAFGTIFMATDPVSSAMTETGKFIYGFLIGSMTAIIRVLNPAFPEGIMLAILFGNVFAPLIDWFVVNANINRIKARTELQG